MNQPNQDACLAPAMIQQFLDEELSAVEEAQAQNHIAACEHCQSTIENLATSGKGWGSFRNNLEDFPKLDSSTQAFDEGALEPFELSDLLAPTDDPDSLGRLGRYEVSGIIGRGSAGIVLKAHDSSLNRYVAIKMLAPGLAYRGSARKRFEREARAIAAVSHPNVIEVHGVEEQQEKTFLVMQYFPGGSLHNRILREGWMTTTGVCRIGVQIARGLSEAHRQGIIHRDIKPANILLEDGTERAVVSDFGLASVSDEVKMTMSGMIAGTPQFMSPEQARGQDLDSRTDLFSLGCVMYAACTGRSPFEGENLMGVINSVCEATPKPIRELNPEIAPWLEDFIHRLLAKDREQRFQTAQEVDEILTVELAYLQMPANIPEPVRDWKLPKFSQARRIFMLFGSLFAVAIAACLFVYSQTGDADNHSKINNYGIAPTPQEESAFEAEAVFELAYRTHLQELALRGDMAKSIEAHQKSLALGFDPAQSAYLMACAYSVEKNDKEVFAWLEKAIQMGFHDYEAAIAQPELKRLEANAKFQAFVEQSRLLDSKFVEADRAYFKTMDYRLGETLYREWLKQCPLDEHAIMMLGAALLEQGKFEEALPWNEKTRHSVRYANFGAYNLGCIAAQRGDLDLAFQYLFHSSEIGFTDSNHLEKDHHLIPLRKDPRFKQLLQKMQQERGI
ncbi:MAG: protein kinase [Planctomycetota bacterium]